MKTPVWARIVAAAPPIGVLWAMEVLTWGQLGRCSECGGLGFRTVNRLRVLVLVGGKRVSETWTRYRCRGCEAARVKRYMLDGREF